MKYSPFINARPVWGEGLLTEKNVTLGFHAEIDGGRDAVIRVATSGFYRVFLNGEFVFYGPARCAHGFFRVDEVPLKLPAGRVHVAIEVVNYYINAFGYIRQPGFIQAEIAVENEVLAATGESGFDAVRLNERVRRIQRYSYQRPAAEAYRMGAEYAAWQMGGWGETTQPIMVTETEEKVLVERRIPLNTFPSAPAVCRESYGTVLSGIIPEKYIKDRSLTGILSAEHGFIEGFFENELEMHLTDEVQEIVTEQMLFDGGEYSGESHINEGEFEILSLACEKTGFITADITCREEGTLYFMFDEILTEEGDVNPLRMDCCNVIRFDLEPGEYKFQAMEPFGFRYLKVVSLKGAFDVCRPAVRELVCPQPITLTYDGDDEVYAAIFAAARESFKQNTSDMFMDCPTRERAAWLCDSYFSARSEYEFTGDNVIEKNFLENYLLPEKFPKIEEGMVPMCYPSDHDDSNFIPNWAMWFVLELCDRNRRIGDREFIDAFRPRVYALLRWFEKHENADGLLEKLPGWIFVEWSKANDLVQDINFPTNMLYAYMLEETAILYDDAELAEKAAALKELIRPYACVDGVELLPFRKLCETKYEAMKLDFPLKHLPEPSHDKMEELKKLL